MTLNLKELEDLLKSSLSEKQTILSSKQIDVYKEKCISIVSVEVILKDGTTLQLAVKIIPPAKPFKENHIFLQRENNFYNIILPTLKYFQEKENLDELYFIPNSYGVKNLSDDQEGFLLLEDLKNRGYNNLQNCDLSTTRQVLKDLASFHAIPLALKTKDPKVFETKTKRYLNQDVETHISPQVQAKLLKLFEDDENLSQFLDKLKEKLEDVSDKAPRVPFSTMIHSACFWKNIMIKTNSDGFVDIKLIDYQQCSYGSLTEDLIYFLYTTVPVEILEEHCGTLMEFYHSNFVRVIEECKCDPTPFSVEALLKEIKIVVNESQFIQILSTLVSNLDLDLAKKKILFIMEDFIKRKWL